MIKENDYVMIKDTKNHCFPLESTGKVIEIIGRALHVEIDGIKQFLKYDQVIKTNIWKCSHCGVVNAARKRKCLKCGTSKKLYQHQRVK